MREKNRVVILSNSHDVLVEDKHKLGLFSFINDEAQALEINLRDFLIKKLRVSLVSIIGIHDASGEQIPVVLIDEGDIELPKKAVWAPVDKFISGSIDRAEFLDAYFQCVLKNQRLNGCFSVWPMGENELDASILGVMVANGKKQATSSLLLEYTKGDVLLPKKGNESVIVDWSGRVLCTIRTTNVRIVGFKNVDESHSAMEMLGDGSVEYWQDVYWDLFSEVCKGNNVEPDDEMDVVCESFEVIHSFI